MTHGNDVASSRHRAFHLLAADDDVASTYKGYVAVCGETLVAGDLPPSPWSEVGSGRDPRYCPQCVREAARWSADAVDRESEDVDQMAMR